MSVGRAVGMTLAVAGIGVGAFAVTRALTDEKPNVKRGMPEAGTPSPRRFSAPRSLAAADYRLASHATGGISTLHDPYGPTFGGHHDDIVHHDTPFGHHDDVIHHEDPFFFPTFPTYPDPTTTWCTTTAGRPPAST